MRVDDNGSAEDGIRNRIKGSGSERSHCQRYQSGRYQSVIVSSARIRWLWNGARASQKPSGSSRGWAKVEVWVLGHLLGFL